MTLSGFDRPTPSGGESAPVVRAVKMIMGTVVALTFLFGFGNVLNLALRLGVPVWVAPLVAPAVDLSVLGLMLGIRHLALTGATAAELQPARRLLIFASLVTLALNVADPFVAGQYGKAAFDAVGPLLLIGWAEVGPGLLQSMIATRSEAAGRRPVGGIAHSDVGIRIAGEGLLGSDPARDVDDFLNERAVPEELGGLFDDGLLARAREEDARHWEQHRRPISAETLRKRLGVGARRARILVSVVRSDRAGDGSQYSVTTG